MHPDMHLSLERLRSAELRAEASRWRLAREHRRTLPPRWAAGVTALGWTLVTAGLRLISLPHQPPGRRTAQHAPR
jgi:hypothetical protein